MYFVSLMRWLRGYVTFSVLSGPGQRLLGLCAANQIRLWNSSGKAGVIRACACVSDYRYMHGLAREIGVITRVEERHGFRFLLRRYRKRIGILAGVILFVLFFAVSQQFIWVIHVNGCENLSAGEMISVLQEIGVGPGTFKGGVDPKSVQRQMMLRVNDLSWCALNIRGTTATLEVRERKKPPEKIDTNIPANVVAAEDGQITLIQVWDGKQMLKKGDTVRAGDMIVSGVRVDMWGLTHLIRANAVVMANVPKQLTVTVPLNQTEYRMVGKVVKRKYLDVFGAHVPLFLYSKLEGNYRMESRREEISIFGMSCDIGLICETYIFYEELNEKISPEQALAYGQNELSRMERRCWDEKTIKSKQVYATCERNRMVLNGEYVVEMDIARQVDIPVLEREKLAEKKPPREGGY